MDQGSEQEVFEELKQLIMSTPILIQPDKRHAILTRMDTSRYTTAAVYLNYVKMTSGSSRVHIQSPLGC